ncbi:MAG: hypothetical protein AAF560_15490 [Acidobacteriota bacterium]
MDQPPNPSRSTRRRFLLGALGASLALCIALIAAGIAFGLGATSRWPEATEPTGLDQVEVPLHGAEAAKRRLDDGFLRGMTVSCPGYGRIWGSRSMQSSLTELASLGVRWVSIHPYAGVRRNGTIRFEPAAETGYLERSVAYAREAGIELFWKPHLAYWGSFEWRGTIEFGEDEAAWRRFFDGYRAFIIDHARFAERHGIPLLSIGLEYERTTGREAEWRRIIADVRRVYSGQITYAANWDRLGAVPFWDALDLIGVQAYFPLSGSADPSIGEIQASWDAHLSRLRELSERYEKPVLFAEIGYDVSPLAASEPWLTKSRDNPTNRALQQRLMEVALSRIEREPHIRGMFWWKWMPGSRNYGDFAMRHPRVMETLRRAWAPS